MCSLTLEGTYASKSTRWGRTRDEVNSSDVCIYCSSAEVDLCWEREGLMTTSVELLEMITELQRETLVQASTRASLCWRPLGLFARFSTISVHMLTLDVSV